MGNNGDDDHELVLIAAYRDLETAQVDFDEVERRLKHGMEMRATALVRRNPDGVAEVIEATNRHGKVAIGVGAGLGALVGLFAPPLGLSLLVGAAAGGLLGVFAGHELHTHLQHEVGEALEAGTAVILAVVYPHGREPMELTLQNANAFREMRLDRSTINEIEGVISEVMAQVKTDTVTTDTPGTSS